MSMLVVFVICHSIAKLFELFGKFVIKNPRVPVIKLELVKFKFLFPSNMYPCVVSFVLISVKPICGSTG